MALFKNIYEGFPWYSSGGTGFVDADDIAKAMVLLMESSISAERYIISAENIPYKNLFFMIADAFGKPRPHKPVTPFIASVVWRLEKLKSWFSKKEPLITKETAATALAVADFNHAKLLQALPSFRYTPLEKSVMAICQHILKNL